MNEQQQKHRLAYLNFRNWGRDQGDEREDDTELVDDEDAAAEHRIEQAETVRRFREGGWK